MKPRNPRDREEVRAFIAGQVEEIRMQLEHLRQRAEAMKLAAAGAPSPASGIGRSTLSGESIQPK